MSESHSIVTTPPKVDAELLQKVLIEGDLSRLTDNQKNQHLVAVCNSLGLNPLTRPFQYINLPKWNAKTKQKEDCLVLYAAKDATDQLRKINRVSVKIVDRSTVEGLCIVTAEASTPDGRTDASIGAVSLQDYNGKDLRGDALANAFMKAETKSKRRVTLSICGLGFLDESEIETIPKATVYAHPGAIPEPTKDPEVLTPDQRTILFNLMTDLNWPKSKMVEWVHNKGFESSAEIPFEEFESLKKELEDKKASLEATKVFA